VGSRTMEIKNVCAHPRTHTSLGESKTLKMSNARSYFRFFPLSHHLFALCLRSYYLSCATLFSLSLSLTLSISHFSLPFMLQLYFSVFVFFLQFFFLIFVRPLTFFFLLLFFLFTVLSCTRLVLKFHPVPRVRDEPSVYYFPAFNFKRQAGNFYIANVHLTLTFNDNSGTVFTEQ
jgi:hypothetical protein